MYTLISLLQCFETELPGGYVKSFATPAAKWVVSKVNDLGLPIVIERDIAKLMANEIKWVVQKYELILILLPY